MNDDLISRDAVLDACSQSINILDAMSRIEDLPSVTPKQKTRYWISHENDGGKSRIGEIGDCIAMAIDEPTITPIQMWIPISERLPEDGTWNLFTDGRQVSVERYKADALNHFYPNGRWFSLEEAVAWMPLPEPYEPQESEDKE